MPAPIRIALQTAAACPSRRSACCLSIPRPPHAARAEHARCKQLCRSAAGSLPPKLAPPQLNLLLFRRRDLSPSARVSSGSRTIRFLKAAPEHSIAPGLQPQRAPPCPCLQPPLPQNRRREPQLPLAFSPPANHRTTPDLRGTHLASPPSQTTSQEH